MRRRPAATTLALLLLGGLGGLAPRAADGAETLPWLMGSYDGAAQRARAERKPLLICCTVGDRAGGELELRLAQHAEVSLLAREFICIRLDPLADETSLRWASGYYELRYPEGVILATPQEERIVILEGEVSPAGLAARMREALELVRSGRHPAPTAGAPAASGLSPAAADELAQARRLLQARQFGPALASFQRVAGAAGAAPEGREAQQAVEAIRREARAGLARAAELVEAGQPGTARLLYAALAREFNGLPEVTEKTRLWLDEIPASEEAGAPQPTPRSVVVTQASAERPAPRPLRPAGAPAKLAGLWEQARGLEALRDYPSAFRVYRRLVAAALRDERLITDGQKAATQLRALESDAAVAQRLAARAKEEPARWLMARASAWYDVGRRDQALAVYQAVGKKFPGTAAASAAGWMVRELQQDAQKKP